VNMTIDAHFMFLPVLIIEFEMAGSYIEETTRAWGTSHSCKFTDFVDTMLI
jgi:hypothetical protein